MPKQKSSGIARWPEDERPRERLLSRGPHALTDAELLAILLRFGVKGKSAVELGRELIKHFGSLQAMMSAPLVAWDDIKSVGKAKRAFDGELYFYGKVFGFELAEPVEPVRIENL